MDPSEESPSSLWMVRAAELFPKSSLEKEDDDLIVPFNERNSEKYFSVVAQYSPKFAFVFTFFFSGGRESQVSRPMGERNSRHLKLQIIHPAHSEAVRGVNSDTADRDRANQGHVSTHHRLQRRSDVFGDICDIRSLFRVEQPNIDRHWSSRTTRESLRLSVPRVGVGIRGYSGSRMAQPPSTFNRLRRRLPKRSGTVDI